jgi:Flp pilus assembly protein TadG
MTRRELGRRLREGAADETGAAAVELALVAPLLTICLFGIWWIGWAIYCGGEVRHAVELGSRIYITNSSATLDQLKTAVSSNLIDIPMSSVTLNAATGAIGSAATEHITWSYSITAAIPFLSAIPIAFSGALDVPAASAS